MAEGTDGWSADVEHEGISWEDQSCTSPADYDELIKYGFNEKVAHKLDQIYQQGKLKPENLDQRALDDLKEFPVDGAVSVLNQLLGSNPEHVSNKSAYLCGVMTYRRGKQCTGMGIHIALALKYTKVLSFLVQLYLVFSMI